MTTAQLKLPEDDVLRLVLDFLAANNLYKTARSFEKETNLVNSAYSESVAFLRELVLDGEWQALQEFSQPLEEIPHFECRRFHFLVARQQYFEILFEKCEGDVKDERQLTDGLLACLIKLEKCCAHRDEYNKLYWYLSAPSLRTEPEFIAWDIDQSRMTLFEEILILLKPFIPVEEYESRQKQQFPKDRLVGLISKGLLYENCIEFCQKRATRKADAADFSLTNIKADVAREYSPKSTGNFYSWLHNLPPQDFVIPFEEITINMHVEKRKMVSKRPDMRSNSLTKSLTFESRAAMKNFQKNNPPADQVRQRDRLSDYSRPSYQRPDINNRDVSQSWADFNIFPKSAHDKFHTTHSNTKVPYTIPEPSTDPKRTVVSEKMINNHARDQTVTTIPELTSNHDELMPSPRKIKQDQQDLVLQQLEAHKQKQKELREQLSTLTVCLSKEENVDKLNGQDPINGIIDRELSSNSLEMLRKSKESLNFLNKLSETTSAVPTTGTPDRPGMLPIADGNTTTEDLRRLSSVSQEPKTPVNTCLPPGLVKLADGSGTFNTSTPKNRKQAFMTPPPPASPVSVEQKSSFKDEHASKLVEQRLKPSLNEQDGSTPKRVVAAPHTRAMPARTLTNEIARQQRSPAVHDETYAVRRKESALTRELKFQKLAVLRDTQAIRSVAFHPNGQYFAVGTNSKSLMLCSVPHAEADHIIRDENYQPQPPDIVFNRTPIHKGSVYCIAFSTRGRILATGSNDKLIKLLRFDHENALVVDSEIELAIHTATVRDVSFVKDASSPTILASGGAGGGAIFLSDCETGQTVSSLKGHSGNIMTVFAASHQNLLCSGSADKSVRVWDLRANKCVDVIPSSSCVASVCFNYEGGPIHLASAHENGQCMVYDVTAKKQLAMFQPHTMDCRTIRYSPDSKYLLTGSYDSSIVITNVLYGSVSELLLNPSTVGRHNDKVIQCRWHPSHSMFLSSSADKTVALWQCTQR